MIGDILVVAGGSDGGGAAISELNAIQIKTLTRALCQPRLSRFTLAHKRSNCVFSVKSNSCTPANELTVVVVGRDGAADGTICLVPYLTSHFGITIENPCLHCVYGRNYMELMVLCGSKGLPFSPKAGHQSTNVLGTAAPRRIGGSMASSGASNGTGAPCLDSRL